MRTRPVASLAALLIGGSLSIGAGFSAASAATPIDPPFVFKNTKTRLCLDDSIHGLRTFACNNTNFQKWVRTFNNADGTWELKNAATGACLDNSSSHGLRVFACNGTSYQRWYYTLFNGALESQGCCKVF